MSARSSPMLVYNFTIVDLRLISLHLQPWVYTPPSACISDGVDT